METAKIVVGIIHIVLSLIIIALILLQSGKQAGLPGAISGAADSFFGKNKGRTLDAMLARFTKICAIGFLITSLFLAYGDTIVENATPDETVVEDNIEYVDDTTNEVDVNEGGISATIDGEDISATTEGAETEASPAAQDPVAE